MQQHTVRDHLFSFTEYLTKKQDFLWIDFMQALLNSVYIVNMAIDWFGLEYLSCAHLTILYMKWIYICYILRYCFITSAFTWAVCMFVLHLKQIIKERTIDASGCDTSTVDKWHLNIERFFRVRVLFSNYVHTESSIETNLSDKKS